MRPLRAALFLTVLSCTFISNLTAATTSPDFFTAPAYPLGITTGGAYAFPIATTDFNHDGVSDVVTAFSNLTDSPNTVSVLIGLKNGTFKPAVNYSITGLAVNIGVGDLNNDGREDIVVLSASPSTAINILLGNGDGTFQKPRQLFVPGEGRSGLAVGDFNGDGDLDIAFNNGNKGVVVLLGKADGTFQAPVTYSAGPLPVSLATADLNGDGKLDLVVANNHFAEILLGNGDGTFQPAVQGPDTAGQILLADVNNDGKLDLISGLGVALGNGNGTFQAEVPYPTSAGGLSVAAIDLNGDGKLDVILSLSSDHSIGVLLGNGNGTFQPPSQYLVADQPRSLVAGKFGSIQSPGIAVTDVSALATNGSSNPGVEVALSNSNGALLAPPVTVGNGGGSFAAAVGDLNGDGKLDVLVTNGVDLTAQFGNGDFTFQPPTPVLSSNLGAGAMAIGDLNGDKQQDIVVVTGTGSTSSSVAVLLNTGSGTFASPVLYPLPEPVNCTIALGDFNGDHKLDIAISSCNKTSSLEILLNNGDGTFKAATETEVVNISQSQQSFALGDFNGDGKLDIATITYTSEDVSQITIFPGKGDGTFSAPVNYPAPTLSGYIRSADFNGDGKLDLVAGGSNIYGSYVSVLLNNGSGAFSDPVNSPAGSGPSYLTVGDFNHDGKQDIATINSAGFPLISVLNGNGDGTFQPFTSVLADSNQARTAVFAGDFNGDNKLDLLTIGTPENGYYTLANVEVIPNMGGTH
jgi:hypothetical protein